MPFPTAPPDGAGGILTIGYTDGRHEYSTRVHVRPFTPVVPGTPYDWTYTTAAGTDVSVRQTAISLMTVLKALYDNNWNFWVKALDRVSGGAVVPVFPLPSIAGQQGTATADFASGTHTVALDNPARFIRSIYSGVTAYGGRFRLTLVAAGVRGLQVPVGLTHNGGGIDATQDQAIANYLQGGNCAVVAHDGHQVGDNFVISVSADPRLRRTLGFS